MTIYLCADKRRRRLKTRENAALDQTWLVAYLDNEYLQAPPHLGHEHESDDTTGTIRSSYLLLQDSVSIESASVTSMFDSVSIHESKLSSNKE